MTETPLTRHFALQRFTYGHRRLSPLWDCPAPGCRGPGHHRPDPEVTDEAQTGGALGALTRHVTLAVGIVTTTTTTPSDGPESGSDDPHGPPRKEGGVGVGAKGKPGPDTLSHYPVVSGPR